MKLFARTIIAVIFSPLVVVPTVVLVSLAMSFLELPGMLFWSGDLGGTFKEWLESTLLLSAIGLSFGYVGVVIVGLPVYFALRYKGRATILACSFAGGLSGLVFGCLFLPEWGIAVATTLSGVTAAAAFCKIAGQSPKRALTPFC